MLHILAILTALAIPFLAHAMQETVWDFSRRIPGEWQFFDCNEGYPTDRGLYVYTEKPCRFFRELQLDHPIDALTFTVQTPIKTHATFLWHVRGSPMGHMVQLPFDIPESKEPVTLQINPSSFGTQWDPHADRIGIALNHRGELLIREIRLQHWSRFEKLREGFLSFWTFDTFRPYSINFLWGPVVGLNPVWRSELFMIPPPKGWFSGYVFYPLIVLAGMISIRMRIQQYALGVFFLSFTALWLIFDLRMGLELLSYVKTDLQHYVLAQTGQRRFRAFEDFYEVYEKSFPYFKGEQRYGIAPIDGSPFASLASYITYPKEILTPGAILAGKESPPVWLVYRRNDMRIDPEGRLVWIRSDGTHPISNPGEIIDVFSDESFLFREKFFEPSPVSPP
ncbi:hypothetical protein A2880_03030 [Candidatus Peribacteria bacterium RIFCSPHIGHO2_01_FULL_49_38]|nr:MAG: hypothetical protein A2880_03030 [Candidatus Peribacteria bacterium RIFCSPHIGHO2_01_FULL_49_38]